LALFGVDSMRFKTSNQININKYRYTGAGLAAIQAWRVMDYGKNPVRCWLLDTG